MPASSRNERFAGKGALVTGAAQGIGRAVAEQLAREGARVVIADASAPQAQLVVEGIRAAGGDATPITADLERAAAVRDVVAQTIERLGAIEAVIQQEVAETRIG